MGASVAERVRIVVYDSRRLISWLTLGDGTAVGMALWPFLLVSRTEAGFERLAPSERAQLLTHETIHLAQQTELLVLPFYLLYFAEWALRFLCWTLPRALRRRRRRGPLVERALGHAYKMLSFEREAYTHEDDEHYLRKRPPFAWVSFL
eukprot:TRINITY_DN17028_c0_g1_i1.p2 TRINITY_DN17028_c0_g1~~TRINITY_DN17028_c0_g1_i1.p2  ORF type:complete len:149 (-),score=44.52 TRINITY_DN17028_c0_g1_i1:55-501(-)